MVSLIVTGLIFSKMGGEFVPTLDEGDFVNKGKILAKLNESTYRTAYGGTTATEKQAQDAYNRLKTVLILSNHHPGISEQQRC